MSDVSVSRFVFDNDCRSIYFYAERVLSSMNTDIVRLVKQTSSAQCKRISNCYVLRLKLIDLTKKTLLLNLHIEWLLLDFIYLCLMSKQKKIQACAIGRTECKERKNSQNSNIYRIKSCLTVHWVASYTPSIMMSQLYSCNTMCERCDSTWSGLGLESGISLPRVYTPMGYHPDSHSNRSSYPSYPSHSLSNSVMYSKELAHVQKRMS